MDKFSQIMSIKKVVIFYIIMLTAVLLLVFILSLLTSDFNLAISNLKSGAIAIMTLAILITILFVVGIAVIKIIKTKNTIRLTKDSVTYFRDLPNNYGPAIASILLDIDLQIHKDYTATIINLCAKKHLKLIKNDEKVSFAFLSNDLSKLLPHELYVYNCIEKNETFNNDIFITKVVDDATKLGLIEEKASYSFLMIVPYYFLSLVILSIMLAFLPSYKGIIEPILTCVGLFLFPIIVGSIVALYKRSKENYHRTVKGKKDAAKWKQLKNFFAAFSLMNEKPIDYVNLLESYLAYAISLGEAKKVEKFIGEDSEYRDLIYGLNQDDIKYNLI